MVAVREARRAARRFAESPLGRHRPPLPGSDLVVQGLSDLAVGVESEAALLVSIGAPRLRQVGVPVPSTLTDPEMRLYRLLQDRHEDAAHGRYNALIRRLVSFQRAAGALAHA
jgi:hypothetical protein